LAKWKLCAFGKQAEKLRKERGMSKKELARRLGFTDVYYQQIIHGIRPGLKQKDRIIEALRMDKPSKPPADQSPTYINRV
jgi:transcriptional regulator with XRE-family HTH domain